ncbi:MAG: hypothetical protein IKX61_07985, partial [Prevotella sp.]|nr:hypothetical protein [Prevotella sp.]
YIIIYEEILPISESLIVESGKVEKWKSAPCKGSPAGTYTMHNNGAPLGRATAIAWKNPL